MEEAMGAGQVTLGTVLMWRWLRLTLSMSGVSGRDVPVPKSSLYWIFTGVRNESIDQQLVGILGTEHFLNLRPTQLTYLSRQKHKHNTEIQMLGASTKRWKHISQHTTHKRKRIVSRLN